MTKLAVRMCFINVVVLNLLQYWYLAKFFLWLIIRHIILRAIWSLQSPPVFSGGCNFFIVIFHLAIKQVLHSPEGKQH